MALGGALNQARRGWFGLPDLNIVLHIEQSRSFNSFIEQSRSFTNYIEQTRAFGVDR